MRNDLKPLYEPESVAVIGASSKPGKPGNDVIRNIMANQYPGRLYLVNPKAEQIEGLPVWPSIDALPEAVDQAILILPAQANPAAIKACAEKGVKSLVLAAGGFAEVDQAGEALQAEITRAIRAAGIRAIGPNTSGHISMPANYTSSFFPLGPIRKGAVSFITQTGNFATHTMRYMLSAEHIGVARVTGLGNKVDLDECDVLEYYADDPATEAIVAYLENLKRPRRFIEIASEVTKTKPMVMLKGGATQEGAAAAMAHTAALASDDRILDGALRQAGITRVYKYSHLILAAKAFSYKPWPLGNRVSFLAPSGAMLVCLTDRRVNRLPEHPRKPRLVPERQSSRVSAHPAPVAAILRSGVSYPGDPRTVDPTGPIPVWSGRPLRGRDCRLRLRSAAFRRPSLTK